MGIAQNLTVRLRLNWHQWYWSSLPFASRAATHSAKRSRRQELMLGCVTATGVCAAVPGARCLSRTRHGQAGRRPRQVRPLSVPSQSVRSNPSQGRTAGGGGGHASSRRGRATGRAARHVLFFLFLFLAHGPPNTARQSDQEKLHFTRHAMVACFARKGRQVSGWSGEFTEISPRGRRCLGKCGSVGSLWVRHPSVN